MKVRFAFSLILAAHCLTPGDTDAQGNPGRLGTEFESAACPSGFERAGSMSLSYQYERRPALVLLRGIQLDNSYHQQRVFLFDPIQRRIGAGPVAIQAFNYKIPAGMHIYVLYPEEEPQRDERRGAVFQEARERALRRLSDPSEWISPTGPYSSGPYAPEPRLEPVEYDGNIVSQWRFTLTAPSNILGDKWHAPSVEVCFKRS